MVALQLKIHVATNRRRRKSAANLAKQRQYSPKQHQLLFFT